jgi:WD40 repeat protein
MTADMELIQELNGHRDAVYAFSPAEESRFFFSSGGDGMIVRWDLSQKNKGDLVASLPAAVYVLVFLAERKLLVAGTRGGGLYFLNLAEKKEEKLLQLEGDIFDIKYQADKRSLIAVTGKGYIYFISLENFRVIKFHQPSSASGREIALSPDGLYAATGWSDNRIRIYDGRKQELYQEFEAHANSVFALSYTPDGRYLISGGRDAMLKVWDRAAGYENIKSLPAHLFTINDIAWNPEQTHFATASRDKTVKIWDGRDFRLLKVIDRTKHAGHSHSVNKLLWTSFGDHLISGGDDKVIRVWQLNFLNSAKNKDI